MSDLQFEFLRAELDSLDVPKGQVRNLRWLAPSLAVARTPSGDFEIFIRGDELRATSSLVRRQLQHGAWRPQEGGEPFFASRIVLPAAPHFASIAALIVIELVRAGISGPRGPQAAFNDVEPIIEMAIRRGALPENVVLGLLGELTLLRQLLLQRIDHPVTLLRCLDHWRGWQNEGRDFQIGDNSIEVKTTQHASSIHDFSGLHQLEPKQLASGRTEKLHVMSIGLAVSTSMGESLPSMVGSIATLLAEATDSKELADELVRRVALYGSQSGVGYTHESMAGWNAYATRYVVSFPPRLYRLDDPAMLLLTRDVLAQTYVQPDGLSFTLHIPDRVSPFNPAPDWVIEVEAMLTGRAEFH
jgi:hypothetical protein